MSEQPVLTAEGAQKLKKELEHLTTTARQELARRLRDAVQQGDLSENADYHKAKEDQGFLEGRIQELEYLLKNAIIVEKNGDPADVVQVGVHVTVQEEDYPPETYYVVGAKEADPRNGRISNESPIGRALMGHKVGDRVIAETPGGKVLLTIKKIE
ncbi:MAG: transcription elongation factor GreA [Anaerolineales bacterium]|nr:transcription elongation factor GreA [Anaerolineales bacterium]MDD5468748.1 transcription elongation factor GreA [Anaerolineales bacterium]